MSQFGLSSLQRIRFIEMPGDAYKPFMYVVDRQRPKGLLCRGLLGSCPVCDVERDYTISATTPYWGA